MIVHLSRCWDCKFDNHSPFKHTRKDADDLYAEGREWPKTRAEQDELATTHPCRCYCQENAT